MLQVADALRSTLKAQHPGDGARLRAADLALIARLVPEDLRPESIDAPESAPDAAGAPGAGTGPAATRSLRVEMAKLDALLTLSGEIAVAKGRAFRVLTAEHAGEAGMAAAEELVRLLATLHEQVMELRLVPVGPLLRQHQRTVRDIADGQSKLVRLVLSGEEVALDATIVAQLREPLTHIVRNAVDHGVEHPAARHAAGKDPCATVGLHARHERGAVIIEVRDDGKGIDRAALLSRARERGWTSADDHLADAQVLALAMLPGLSTAARVTELSGRGVGMDAVRRSIETLRGSIELESEEGKGTVVRLRLPLTVAIIDGFAVQVADERYVIPVGAVSECLSATDAPPSAAAGVLSMRGRALPYVRLRHLLAAGGPGDHVARESVVIVESDGRRVGLVVDDLLGETQAVIAPLAEMFSSVRGVSGTTILADGRVSLVLDVPTLLELADQRAATARSAA
jgi:two-component system chemotaxis sensor kinase CheA